MRIGYDAKRLFNNFTGLGNYSRTLVSNLRQFYPEEEYFLYTTKISSDPVVNRFVSDPGFTARISGSPFRSLWRTFFVTGRLKEDRIDLFHGLSGEIPVTLRRSGIKSIVTIHDLVFLVYPRTYKPADRFFYDRKFRFACNNADAIVAISNSTREDLIRFYNVDPSRIRVIYQACDPVFYSESEAHSKEEVARKYNLPGEFILYVGSVIPRKNLLAVVKSLAALPSDLRIPLVAVGDGGSYKAEVKRYIASLKPSLHVIWIEDLHESRQLKALYNLASAFIYPSLCEGFGIPVAEALLSGVPVITSDRSSLPEAGGPSSMLVDPESCGEISAGIEKVLTDSMLRERMIEEGRRYANEKFSPRVTAGEVIRLYSAIVP